MVQMNFNANQYDPSTGVGDVFETGEYTFHIVKSEPKQTKAGNGTMLIFEMACLDEGQNGKRLTVRLNVQNPSQQAVEIAFRDLSAISHVCGVLVWSDTQELHGKPFRVRLEKVPRSDDPSKFGNEVRAYMDVNGNPPGQQSGAAAGGAPAAPQAPAQPAGDPSQSPQPSTQAPALPGSAPATAAAPAPDPAPVAQPAAAPADAPASAPQEQPAAAPPWTGQQTAPTADAAQSATPPWAQG